MYDTLIQALKVDESTKNSSLTKPIMTLENEPIHDPKQVNSKNEIEVLRPPATQNTTWEIQRD